MLAMFDLDGFKAYNDTYGHATGDELLKRLGDKLAAAMAGRGQSYRMGGDEFCVLAAVPPQDAPETIECAAQALSDRGDGFMVRASCGWVLLPDERGADPSSALRIADRRMYAQKNLARASAGTADGRRAAEGAVRAVGRPRRAPARRDGALPRGRRATGAER